VTAAVPARNLAGAQPTAPLCPKETTMTLIRPEGRPAESAAAEPCAIAWRAPTGREGLGCWIVQPKTPRPGATPLLAIHGINRGADGLAGAFAAQAAAEGRTVIAPLFAEENWRGYQRLVAPRRADLALMALLEDLRLSGVIGAGRVDLFGYSGGAQCAHRFAMLHPQQVRRLSACAAGWWTFPDAAAFPYGHGGAADGWGARMAAALPEFLRLDIAVSVGGDDDRPDPAMRSAPAIDAQQGRSRLERARRWTGALIAAAATRGLPAPKVSFTVLPGAGHDFTACARAGLVGLTLGRFA